MTLPPDDPPSTFAPSLRTSVGLNFSAHVVPVLCAAASVPVLTRGLDPDRFGILMLGWTFFGTVGIFDFGLGRSITQVVAEQGAVARPSRLAGIVWLALGATLVVGTLGSVLLAIAAQPLVDSVSELPDTLAVEAHRSIIVLAMATPIVLTATTLRGLLEGFGRFDYASWVRIPVGGLTFLAPVGVILFVPRVDMALASMLVVRVLGWIGMAAFSLRTLPALIRPERPSKQQVRATFRLGGWMTVSNLVTPLLVYFDRLLIGAMISLQAVAYYATPGELATRVLSLPVAVTGVVFTHFAAHHTRRPEAIARVAESSIRLILIGVVPLLLVLIALANPILATWAGAEFADNGTAVLEIFAMGMLFNALAQVPFSLIHGAARPDAAARLHLIEAPLYLAGLAWALPRFGLAGAAVAWSLRAALDALGMFAIAIRVAPSAAASARFARNAGGCSLALLGTAWWLSHVGFPLIGLGVSGTLFIGAAWVHIVRPEWRGLVRARRGLFSAGDAQARPVDGS